MGAGGERIPNPNSSAEGEHLMVVGNNYVLKMVAQNDQNTSQRCRDCSHGLQTW